MSRIRAFLIIFLLVALAWWWWWPRHETSPPPARVLPSPAPVVAPAAPREQKIETPKPTPSESRSRPARQVAPPTGSVPFRVHKGLVVAYGDVLLGKTPRPDYPNTGFVSAPELRLWQNATIPFAIDPQLPNPERVLQALRYLQENTPIRFSAYAGEPDALFFMPLEGACLSYLGRVGGNQPIYLDANCGTQEILHEIMHALGFIHEHSRLDRDRYLAIDWRNVQPDKEAQFWLTPATWNEALLQRPFDLQSVMMYPPEAFAIDRSKSVLYARGSEPIAPVKSGLSPEDLERVRTLYGGR